MINILRAASEEKGQSQAGMCVAHVITDIADRAAGGYDKHIDGAPEIYARWVIEDWYVGDHRPDFMYEPHYQWVMREYSFKIADEIVKWIDRWAVTIAEHDV